MRKSVRLLLQLAVLSADLYVLNGLVTDFSRKIAPQRRGNIYNCRFGKINYVVQGEGPPLLLIHDASPGASLVEWEIDSLSKNYTVYALDMFGFGNSDRPAISYSAYLYTGMINSFVVDVVKEPVYAVGSSGGAAFLTAANCMRPDLYRKLILISPTGVGAGYRPVSALSSLLKRLIDLPIYGTSAYLAMYCRFGRNHLSGKHAVSSLIGNFLNLDITRLLCKIESPTIILWGGKNKSNPVSNYRDCTPLNSNLELVVFEDSAAPHLDSPIAFEELCRKLFC